MAVRPQLATRKQVGHITRAFLDGDPGFDREMATRLIESRYWLPGVESLRARQAWRLWDLKFGDVLGCKSFAAYLDAKGMDSFEPVPLIPDFPEAYLNLFGDPGPRNLWLIDGRVAEKVGIKEYLRLIGVTYYYESNPFKPYDPNRVKSGIRWMLGQAGYRNQRRRVDLCRQAFAPFEVGMDWVEGGGVYGLNPKVVKDQRLKLPGSIGVDPDPERVPFIELLGEGSPTFTTYWNGDIPSGVASRGE